MSKFLSDLYTRNIDDISHDGRGSWQLLRDLVYQSDVAQKIIRVPKKFITDFASVPRIPIAYLLVGDTAHKAAVIHDYLYTTHEVTRKIADEVLFEAAIVCGIPRWRANILWSSVDTFGGKPWELHTKQVAEIKDKIDRAFTSSVAVILTPEPALA